MLREINMKNYFEYANKDYKNTLFLKLIIVSLPFNALPYFSNIFGELAQEGAFYVLVIGIIVSIIKMDKIYLLKNNFQILQKVNPVLKNLCFSIWYYYLDL